MRTLKLDSPLGTLTLCERQGALVALLMHAQDGEDSPTPLLSLAARELKEYFSGERRSFDLPLCLGGTAFQRALWQALLQLEYGECVTYGTLAALAGYPRACRAVGNALHCNPLPIFLPCHRVVGSSGLGNYAWGMEKKLFLMRLEGMEV